MKHCDQILRLLEKQIGNVEEVEEIHDSAKRVKAKWIDPLSGGREDINGLVYGLVQSGKTGVLSVTGALGADEGYKTIIILTSDNDPLYEQTLGRVQEAFPGMDVLGKNDFKDRESFLKRVKGNTCAIVTTKNVKRLNTLVENFTGGKVRGLTCLIIDDEADQASPNTFESKGDNTRSPINEKISQLRSFFDKNTYLQVTATPQALFLQRPGHSFRPKFTVLSHPGQAYVGGDDFFGENSQLVREFPLTDITTVAPGAQPTPRLEIPGSLLQALDTFMIGATYKRMQEPDQNCAFLCHVSTRKTDHKHIVELLRKYKVDLASELKSGNRSTLVRLKAAYDDLAASHNGLKKSNFEELLTNIQFLSPGTTVKLVNGETDEDVAVRSPYNLFVGGNKLGRGVTIKNLLVSYYGRHPRRPQADTVLQHARMYGYRRKDIGLLRLFLPRELHTVFRAIHEMEHGLRSLIEQDSNEEFRGIYVSSGVNPTRRNILAPGSLGVYSGGGNYNPSQVLRDASVKGSTAALDRRLENIKNKSAIELPIEELISVIQLTKPDPQNSEHIWNTDAIVGSLRQFAQIRSQTTGFVYVDRDRGLGKSRRETQGIIEGGEYRSIPDGKVGLFLLRTTSSIGNQSAWWPQIRFPSGRYAFAFAV